MTSPVKLASGVGAGDANVHPKFLFCQNFGQTIKTFGQRDFDIFCNINYTFLLLSV